MFISTATSTIDEEKRKKQENALFHYTDESGLYGILETQTLWMTHFAYLNDNKEVKHFLEDLSTGFPGFFFELFKLYRLSEFTELFEKQATNPERDKELQQLSKEMDNFLETAAPFIVSFCKHDPGSYAFLNGDLSMWRAYGQTGGYALVLSEAGLKKIIENEQDVFHYLKDPAIFRIEYDLHEKPSTWIDEKIKRILVKNKDCAVEEKKTMQKIHFTEEAYKYKHEAFAQENETRIAAWIKISKEQKRGFEDLRPKEINFRCTDKIPYLIFNETPFGELPIEKIIVGPHPLQNDREKKLKDWLNMNGRKIEVAKSNTPLVVRVK